MRNIGKQLHSNCVGSLCNKLYISIPPYGCVRQVYNLQSSLSVEYLVLIVKGTDIIR